MDALGVREIAEEIAQVKRVGDPVIWAERHNLSVKVVRTGRDDLLSFMSE